MHLMNHRVVQAIRFGLVLFALSWCCWVEDRNVQGSESWPRFRGPNGCGLNDRYEFPDVIREEHVVWRIGLGGSGHSSPVIGHGRVFVASSRPETGEQILEAFDLITGKGLWTRTLPGKVYPKHEFNSFASSTPALDEESVYYAWANPDSLRVIALRQEDGTPIWEVDLGPFVSQHGFGASPIVYRDLVILPNEQDGESFVVALDSQSGKIRWKTPRRTQKAAYSTPCLLTAGPAPHLILTSWAHGIASLDPQTGEPLWELSVFHNRTVGSPLVVGELIVASSGEGGIGREMYVIQVGKVPENPEPKILYEVRTSIPYVPTPVAQGDRLYSLYDKGIVTCLDLRSGSEIWRRRIPGEYFSSPLILGRKIYCISRTGTLVVLGTGDQFQLLGTSELGEGTHSTPAVADGVLVIRTFTKLLAVKSPNLEVVRN